MKKTLTALALIVAAPGIANANDHKFSVGVGESILGHTIEGTYAVTPHLSVRALYGNSDYDFDVDSGDRNYESKLGLGGAGVLVDLHPGAGAFRITAGAMKLDTSFDASTSGTMEFGGTSYTSTIDATASFKNEIAPVVAIGFAKPIFGSRFILTSDIGAAYTGGMNFEASDRSGTIPQDDVDRETEELRDTLEKADYVPFIKIGLNFAF
jgi:hypothetical protein